MKEVKRNFVVSKVKKNTVVFVLLQIFLFVNDIVHAFKLYSSSKRSVPKKETFMI